LLAVAEEVAAPALAVDSDGALAGLTIAPSDQRALNSTKVYQTNEGLDSKQPDHDLGR
jgi:hypothetical protein